MERAIIGTPRQAASKAPGWKVIQHFVRNPLGIVGGGLLLVVTIAAVFAPWFAPYDPAAIFWEHVGEAPSLAFPFGTDEIGRDLLSRVVYGARISLYVVTVSILIAVTIGSVVGLISGYAGGAVDNVIMRINDSILAFPMLILALGIIAVLGPGLNNAVVAIAAINIPGFVRVVRGQVLSVREKEFVEAARSLGASRTRILAHHVWPHVRGAVIVYASVRASASLITESGLAFLGLGVPPPTPTWGQMLATAMGYWDAWWMSVFPGLALFLVVLGLNFAGDALLDAISINEED